MRNFLFELITNRVFLAAVFSWAAAQGSKILFESVKYGFSKERLTGGGGMPSSHTATVTGLTTAAAAVYGPGGFEFPMALFFSIVVVYDAMNVRYETGRQAKVLNEQRRQRIEAGEDPLYDRPFVEKIGHTLPEVVVGAAVGIIIGLIVGLV